MNTKRKNLVVASLVVALGSLALALNNAGLVPAIDESASAVAVASYTPSKYGPSAGNASQVSMSASQVASQTASQVARQQRLARMLESLDVVVG